MRRRTRRASPALPAVSLSASMDATEDVAAATPAAGEDPDIHELFCLYNALYFRDSLGACALSWSSSAGYIAYCHCYSNGGGCEIHLSKPLLQTSPATDLKNVLLHEMIHAYLWIEQNNRDHNDHGASFQAMMNSINSSSAIDPHRPTEGYNVTVDHDVWKDQHHKRTRQSLCKLCGNVIISSMNKGPSASDSTENLESDECCDNLSCQWQSHKKLCSDTQEQAECNSIKTSSTAKIYKRSRASTSKEDFCTSSKRRKPAKSDEWRVVLLGLFDDEETDDEAEVPLINKRSERRKKQKLLHNPMNQNVRNEANDGDTQQQNLSPIVMDISDG